MKKNFTRKNQRSLGFLAPGRWSVMRLFQILLLVVTTHGAHAQSIVSGTVTDELGQSLPGVNVVVKGTTLGTTTDGDGKYSISANGTDVLVFSFIGFAKEEVAVNNRTQFDLSMTPDIQALSEIVVVGYGEQKKTSTTAAISTLKASDVSNKPVVNLSNNLTGRIAGLVAVQGSGEPGLDGSRILIRGVSSTGNTNPLLVVDGIYRDFTKLDPNSIESITVLKDAAAVAPYGIAGANGVILVTTKKGKSGKPRLSYNGYVGFQNPTRLVPQVNSYEYALMRNEAAINDGLPPAYTADDITGYKNAVNGVKDDKYPNSSPLKDILKKNSMISYHNISLSGGSDKVNYFVGFGYTNQNGMYKPTYIKKYNLIGKVEADVTNTTKIGLNINGWVEDQHYPPYGSSNNSDPSSIFYQAYRTPPTSPVYYANGTWGSYIGQSLIGRLYHSGFQTNQNNQIYTTFTVDQKLPLKGLSIKGVASYDPTLQYTKRWRTPIPFYTANTSSAPYDYVQGLTGPAKSELLVNNSYNRAFTYWASLNYDRTFNKHSVTFTGVVESRTQKYQFLQAERVNYNASIPELDAGSADPNDFKNNGISSQQKQFGYMGRLTYNFNEKYFVEATGRYDGNFAFAPGKRYGFFPAASVGWRLSEESFIRDNFSMIDQLKIRASYGESGNLPYQNGQLAAFQFLSTYGLYSPSAVLGTSPTQGAYERLDPNPVITWERARKSNIGLETSLYSGKYTLQADVFYERRSQMLVTPNATVSQEYGIDLAQVNSGIMDNKGFEISATTFQDITNDLKLSITANFTYARNKVIEIFESEAQKNNPNQRRTGQILNSQYGYHALGYFQAEDDKNNDGVINAADGYDVVQFGDLHPGDLKYQDIAGPADADGKLTGPDGKIDQNDVIRIGNPNYAPLIQFGFIPKISYKGFDLEVLVAGAAKANLYLNGAIVSPFSESGSATKLEYNNHWTPNNRDALYPRLTSTPYNNNTQGSDWWIRNSSYVRIKSAELGYTVTSSVLQKVKVQQLRVYVSAQNLFTWTPKMKEIVDPEASLNNGQFYPQQRVVSVGLNLTL